MMRDDWISNLKYLDLCMGDPYRWYKLGHSAKLEGNYYFGIVLMYFKVTFSCEMWLVESIELSRSSIIAANYFCLIKSSVACVVCCFSLFLTFDFPSCLYACLSLVLLSINWLVLNVFLTFAFCLKAVPLTFLPKMTIISQLEASSSGHPMIPSSPNLPSWVNRFASPQPDQPLVVVEGSKGTFTLESEVTRVSTSLCLSLNVEHMESKVLMGKLVGKQIEARTIKWKLGLTWVRGSRIPFVLTTLGTTGMLWSLRTNRS